MNQLNYQAMYRYEQNLNKEYEKYKCDPRKYKITFCKNLLEDDCPKTCGYATKLEKEVKEKFE